MEYINPKHRFSTNTNALQVSIETVRAAASLVGLDANNVSLERLSGGFMNANFTVRSPLKSPHVFRVYSTNLITAEREFDILSHVERSGVLAPRPIRLVDVEGQPIGVMSYVDGVTLEDYLIQNGTINVDLFSRIGHHLAKVHMIAFERPGFIGPKLSVGDQYENFGLFIKGFIKKTMASLGDDRLDRSMRERVLRLVDELWDAFVSPDSLTQLVHCDFNPKNIMVTRQGDLAAFLDWEFCLAGDGLMDLANFFRFSYDYPAGAEEAFAIGYQAGGGKLSPRWRDAGRLLDLGNMCSFLERRENYQKTFSTARAVLQETVEHFGY